MRRRPFLIAMAATAAAPALADAPKAQSLADARRWIDRLGQSPRVSTSGAWPLGVVLAHLAQSIEMSMDGYPQPRSDLFQATAGSAAFAFFKWRGRMSHGLAEPIPGAPPLAASIAPREGLQRLGAAIQRFEAYSGALKPHFAYGQLSKSDYALAHSLHIANHQDEIVIG